MTAPRPFHLALALSGGNALGSWQAGAFEALVERGYAPDWIAGASAGAIDGAVIVGNPPERAVERLRALWAPTDAAALAWWPAELDQWRRSLAIAGVLGGGRPDLFAPRLHFAEFWSEDGSPPPSLFDTRPLEATLRRSVDWDLLNRGSTRFTITAVDLETGEDALFDSRRRPLGPKHVRASTALMPVYPPVEVDGRWYVDPGLSANLPLDAVLAEPPGELPLLVIALDLLPVSAPVPRTLGEAAGRLQDLIFAAQTRRTVDAWRTIYDLHGESAPAVTLARLTYEDQGREVAGKAFDFSPETAGERWRAGAAAMTAFLDRLDAGGIEIGRPGLAVYRDPREAPLTAGGFRLRTAETAD